MDLSYAVRLESRRRERAPRLGDDIGIPLGLELERQRLVAGPDDPPRPPARERGRGRCTRAAADSA